MRATSQVVAILGTGALTLLATTAPALAMRVPADPALPTATTVARAAADPTAGPRVPISAHVAGTATASASGNKVAFDAKGSGTLRGYGPISFEAKGTLDPNHPCPSFGAKETVTVTNGPAKGSRLIGHVDGYGCPQPKSPHVLDVQALNQVSAGTGRFTGADGGWIVTGTFNLATGAFTHDLRGLVITSPHA